MELFSHVTLVYCSNLFFRKRVAENWPQKTTGPSESDKPVNLAIRRIVPGHLDPSRVDEHQGASAWRECACGESYRRGLDNLWTPPAGRTAVVAVDIGGNPPVHEVNEPQPLCIHLFRAEG